MCYFNWWDDISRLTTSDLKFDSGKNGQFIRVELRGGKTQMNANFQNEKLITENLNNPEMCLYKFTEEYLSFLGNIHILIHIHSRQHKCLKVKLIGTHPGSLQPTCSPKNPNLANPTCTVGYTLALEDLKKTITEAG